MVIHLCSTPVMIFGFHTLYYGNPNISDHALKMPEAFPEYFVGL